MRPRRRCIALTRPCAQAVAPQWRAAAVSAPDFPVAAAAAAAAAEGGSRDEASSAATAAGPSPFGQEEKRLFLGVALRNPPLPQVRAPCVLPAGRIAWR